MELAKNCYENEISYFLKIYVQDRRSLAGFACYLRERIKNSLTRRSQGSRTPVTVTNFFPWMGVLEFRSRLYLAENQLLVKHTLLLLASIPFYAIKRACSNPTQRIPRYIIKVKYIVANNLYHVDCDLF